MNTEHEHYKVYGDEPEQPKNYKTATGYQAVVTDKSSDYLYLIFKNGKTVGRREIAF